MGSEVVELLEMVVLAGLVAASMTALTTTEPVNTPTTLTREVSVMLSMAHRLLMKLVRALVEKKVLMSMAK